MIKNNAPSKNDITRVGKKRQKPLKNQGFSLTIAPALV